MISVILAGGRGLRLWPESRRQHPKQLCKFVEDKCMLDHTIDRLLNAGFNRVAIITTEDLAPLVQQIVDERPEKRLIEILSEPEGKNTAPAIGLALAKLCRDNPDSIIGVFPADHHVLDTKSFVQSVSTAVSAARKGYLTTIGISPDRAETGFGYIERAKWEIEDLPNVFQVHAFYEKPDLLTAQDYLASKHHLWNAGIYIAKVSTYLDEFAFHLPDIHRMILQGYEAYIQSYQKFPEISIDYGIAEKSQRMAVVPADFGWCDLGSWNALAEICPSDAAENVLLGNDVIVKDSHQCVVRQTDKTIVLFGVENLLVVETDNVVFVTERNKTVELKTLVDYLTKAGREDLL